MAKKEGKMKGTLAVGVGLGMLAAGVAGAYYLYGTPEGAKKKQKIKGWILKAKGEVLEKIEAMKDLNEDTYNNLIGGVMKKYAGMKNIDKGEVEELVSDLKKHWKNIKKHIDAGGKTAKTVKKAVKKVAKKIAA